MTTEEKTTEQLAIEAFEAREYLQALAMQNTTHLDYEGRKAQAVEYALAQEKAFKAQQALAVRTSMS